MGAPLGADTPGVVLPRLVQDPVWSLRPWAVEVELAGQLWVIPPLSAVEWLVPLMGQPFDPEDLFPGLLPSDQAEELDQLVFDGKVDLDELGEATLSIITTASGRPWWVTLRLIADAYHHWDLLGAEMLLAGVDATRVSLGAWLDALLLFIVRAQPDDKLTMYFSKLEKAPAGYGPKPEEIVMSMDDFKSMMADG